MIAGHWKQHELWDGTYTLDDLADIHEMMAVQSANEETITQYVREREGVSSS